MAMTGVLRPGHISCVSSTSRKASTSTRTPSAWLNRPRRPGPRLFQAWDEREHNSVLIREAESAGVDFFAFKVADKATLDKLDADLQAFGLKTERIPAGEMLETGERVRF